MDPSKQPRRPRARRTRPIRTRLALAAGAILGALLCGELALRALGLPRPQDDFSLLHVGEPKPIFEHDPLLFWRLRPDARKYDPNRLGLRGYWPQPERSPATLRIACVGDSSTFGIGHRYEDAYGIALEQLLQERLPHRDVEAVLAALPGFSTFQDLALYRAHVAALRPDVTVLYVGAWNDFAIALDQADAERAAAQARFEASPLAALRLARAARAALEAWRTRGLHDRAQAILEGTAASGPPRVPLDAFRANVEALIDAVRAHGGHPIALLPPLPEATVQDRPVALRYRAALREIAQARGATIVDGPRVIADAEAALPAPLRTPPGEPTPGYIDAVHPSPLGHRALAECLARAVLVALPALADPVAGGGTPRARIDDVPARLDPATERALLVRGSGFAAPGAVERVWFGDYWVRAFTVEADDALRLAIPPLLPPGPRRVCLRTPAGMVQSAPVDVAERRLQVTTTAKGGLAFSIADCPPSHVHLWFSDALAEVPRDTPYGSFWLFGHAPPAPAAPVQWTHLRLPVVVAQVDAPGTWTLRHGGTRAAAGKPFWAQVLLLDAERTMYGVLTPPVALGGK